MMCIRAYLVVYAHHLCSPNHPLDTCFNLKDSSIFQSTPRIKAKAGFNIQCLAFLSAAMNYVFRCMCSSPFNEAQSMRHFCWNPQDILSAQGSSSSVRRNKKEDEVTA
ncbi:hypothetical protein HAX54_002681 [Datura stramonium]|uniref:Uncharacterized protein n=1 Tax=Datura stramonium TaxID=4076 RepID=A0ABS8RWF2_DATST|nr:hypothetical protein [Datura stramonium]